jgi:predicted DNA-binding WGR domain protein
MKHHLIYKDDKSDKFWKIEVNENSFTVTYGKTGTAGTSQTKDFDSEAKCLKEAEKLVAEKKKKGYVPGNVNESTNTKALNSKPHYSKMLNTKSKKDLHVALIEHFSYLVDTPGFERVLSAVMSVASEMTMKKDVLHIKLNSETVLVAEPPLNAAKYEGYPESFRRLMAQHSSLSIDYPINCSLYASDSFMDDGWGEGCEELEKYDDVKTAINIGSDLYIYHPEEKNTFGESVLYFLDHEEGSLGASEDMNAGSLFLTKLCEILEIKVEIPKVKLPAKIKMPSATAKPQELDEIWWNSLEPIWKIVFAMNFPDKKWTIRVTNSFDLKRAWNDLKPEIDAIHEPWKKVPGLTTLVCTLKNNGNICEFQVKDLTPVASLIQLKKLSLAWSKVRSLSPLQNLHQLEILDLNFSEALKDLEGIENLHSLREIDLSNTAVKDLELVYRLKNLKILVTE